MLQTHESKRVEGGVSAKNAGLIATAMAYSHLSFRHTGLCFSRAYVQLSEFIHQQDDRRLVLAALERVDGA